MPFAIDDVGWRGVVGAVVESPDAALECVLEGRRCGGICFSAVDGEVSGPVEPFLDPSATGLRRALVRSLTGACREEFIEACETDRPNCADSIDAPSDPFIWPNPLSKQVKMASSGMKTIEGLRSEVAHFFKVRGHRASIIGII